MQDELGAADTSLSIEIVGVNEVGFESGNDTFTDGRDLPWLQEAGEGVWGAWNVTYRDVIIVDGENKVVAVYNLTDNDLADTAKYDALKQLFLDAAE